MNVKVPSVATLMVPIEAPSSVTSMSNCAVGLVPMSPKEPAKSAASSTFRVATHLNMSSEEPCGPPA